MSCNFNEFNIFNLASLLFSFCFPLAGPRETAKVSPVRKGMFCDCFVSTRRHVECFGSDHARHKVHRSKSRSPNCRQNLHHLKALGALRANPKISHIPDLSCFVLQGLQVLQRGEVLRWKIISCLFLLRFVDRQVQQSDSSFERRARSSQVDAFSVFFTV